MNIAVVGSGAAGTTAAWLLSPDHQVTVFEAGPRPGGHAWSVTVEHEGRQVIAELGAEFVYEEGYSGLHALIGRLNVPVQRTKVAVSINIEGEPGFMMPPRHARGMRSVLRPRTIRDLVWMARLAAAAEKVADTHEWGLSVDQLLTRVRVPRDVADRLIVPLIASSWGVERAQARELAAYSVVRVMGLRLAHEPHTFSFRHGLGSYIDALLSDSPGLKLNLNSPVTSLDVLPDKVQVSVGGRHETFDRVILACDWHNSAGICAESPSLSKWHDAFTAFPDMAARVAVHKEAKYMPSNRGIWSKGNFWLTRTEKPRTTVWSGQLANAPVFRTWLRDGESEPATTTHVADFRHIVITPEHPRRQSALASLQGQAGVYAAGMYTTGIDNHESALRSALLVAERISPQGERVRWFKNHVSD